MSGMSDYVRRFFKGRGSKRFMVDTPAKALIGLARQRLKDLTGDAESNLAKLIDEYEAAECLSHSPAELLIDKPKRYREQVQRRVEHWAEKAAALENRLRNAVDSKKGRT